MSVYLFDFAQCTVTIGGIELARFGHGDMLTLKHCPPWARWERFKERRYTFRRARRSFTRRMRQRRSWGMRA